MSRRVRKLALQGHSPPQGLEIGEKLLCKKAETRHFGFFLWSEYFYNQIIIINEIIASESLLEGSQKLGHNINVNIGQIISINIDKIFGSGALLGKMLLVRFVENNNIDAYFRACWVK